MKSIFINHDFISGKEVPYLWGKYYDDNFETHCLIFFNEKDANVTIRKKDGSYINNQELYANKKGYCDKEIREAHNLLKIFLAGGFNWLNCPSMDKSQNYT